jgi:hypothetical protein
MATNPNNAPAGATLTIGVAALKRLRLVGGDNFFDLGHARLALCGAIQDAI